MKTDAQESMDRLLHNLIRSKKVFSAACCISDGENRLYSAAGEMHTASQFFIASTTKLYITTVIYILMQEGKIELKQSLRDFYDIDFLKGIHNYKGNDECSANITIAELMSHTSGLPDYFQQSNEGQSLLDRLVAGEDEAWSFSDVISWSKDLKAAFRPSDTNHALYSDTNFQILGDIIEKVTGLGLQAALTRYIFEPLQLTQTYLYEDSSDTRPVEFYNKRTKLHIPKAMSSFRADGGIVSTTDELMTFLEAFFQGKLFDKALIDEMMQAPNAIFFPFQYGIGIMRFQMPLLLRLFTPVPYLLGHSGLSGVFAFYSPDKELFITGTLNQMSDPSLAFKFMLKAIAKVA